MVEDTKLDQFMQVAQEMFPQFSILPEQCRNLFCNAQRKAKGTGSIKSLTDSMLNDAKAIGIIAKDVGKNLMQTANAAIDTIGSIGTLAKDTLKNMYDNFKIYDTCSRRFKDFVQDNLLNSVQNLIQPGGALADMANVLSGTIKNGGNLLDPFSIIGNKFMQQISKSLNSELMQCITKTAATASITLDTVIDIKQVTQANIDIKKGNFSDLTKLYKDKGKSLSFSNIVKTPKFNLSIANTLGNTFKNSLTILGNKNSKDSALTALNNVLSRQTYIEQKIIFYQNELKSLNL